MAKDKIYELMELLIRRSDVNPHEIPALIVDMLSVANQAPQEPVQEAAPMINEVTFRPSPNLVKATVKNKIGWPEGVKKEEFQNWKRQMIASGYQGSLNPHYYKLLRDTGKLGPSRIKASELVTSVR